MTDKDHAIQEGERIAAADEYFQARTWLMDTNDNRRIFEAGFDRAYALLSKLRAPVAGERAAEQTAPGRQYHLLKTDPEVFQAVLSGAKTFEIRMNDRGYAVGDVLGLRETKHTGAETRAGAPLVYTGRECQRFVSHVLTGYGLADGWCCLSFKLPHAGGASAPVAGEAQTYRPTKIAVREACDLLDKIKKSYGHWGGWSSIPSVCDEAIGLLRYSGTNVAPQASEAVRILFPTHLRKMWSGGEVQAWLDEHQGVTTAKPSAKGSLQRYREWQANQDSGVADLRQAFNTFGSKVFKALAAIARVDGPDMRKEDDPELIYREPVMDEAVRIRQAYDELSAALSAQPGAQKNGGSDAE